MDNQLIPGVVAGLISGVILLALQRVLNVKFPKDGDLDTPNREDLEKHFQILVIGILSGFLGAIGHFFGRIFENPLALLVHPYFGRFANDFFRILFWNIGIGFLYFYAFHRSLLREIRHRSPFRFLMAPFIPALICGALFPLLNLVFHGEYLAPNQSNLWDSILWFSTAGSIFGITSTLTWVLLLDKNQKTIPTITGGVLCLTYGLFLGVCASYFGGIGLNDAQVPSDTAFTIILFIGILVPVSIFWTIWKRSESQPIPASLFNVTFSMFVGVILGIIVGYYLGSNSIIFFVKESMIQQYGTKSVGFLVTVVFTLITNIPWGICIVLGILRSEKKQQEIPLPP